MIAAAAAAYVVLLAIVGFAVILTAEELDHDDTRGLSDEEANDLQTLRGETEK